MVAAVQAIHSAYSDPEYLRILQELMKLGIAPSGNKSIDKMKLEQAKAELIQKIQTRQEEEQKQTKLLRMPRRKRLWEVNFITR